MSLNKYFSWLGCLVAFLSPTLSVACQLASPTAERENIFARHLVGTCTQAQRQALAIPSQAVLDAIRHGRHLDLVGVEIAGAIHFDRLPMEAVSPETVPTPELRAALRDRGIEQVRVVRGSLSILDSHMPDVLATNLTDGAIIFHGPVVMKGTAFQRSIDFSKAVFLQPVDFSNAIVLYEAFFIGARFEQSATFAHVSFGTHTRFHRAVFEDAAIFAGSRFQGLAEFLEIRAERNADFSHTVFVQGTGFSGAQFRGTASFSHARFEHETFFRFTKFQAYVDFTHAVFERQVDFTNAVFADGYDFSRSRFAAPPNLDIPMSATPSSNSLWPWFVKGRQQLVVFVLLATVTIWAIWAFRRV